MALGAAKYLADTRRFKGTLHFIFQPSEENMKGGPAMIEDGLFEKFQIDRLYAMHNIPGLPKGVFHFHDGETMSAVDNWEIELTGKGSHGSMPELSIDPVVAGASLVMALQTIVSRNISPWDNGVVTIGAFLAGNEGNVIANSAILRLSMRNMQSETRKKVLDRIRKITAAQAECYGCTYEIREGQPGAVLVNSAEETKFAADVARRYFGEENVETCGVCDICTDPPVSIDATELAAKAISAVMRMDQRFGRGRVVGHLLGKANDEIDQRYADRTTFGIGADQPEALWRNVIEHLLFEGVLSEGDDERPTLAIGDEDAVRAIFKKERAVRVREAARTGRRSKEERRATRGAKDAVREGFKGEDAKLFDALKSWRRETANASAVPPYVIFHDATLAGIVRAKPANLVALGRVPGIGEAKLKKYGNEVLAVVIAGI